MPGTEMQRLKQIPFSVLVLAIGQLAFALAVIVITGHGLLTLDYAPYEPAFFSPLAQQVAGSTLAEPDRATVVEIVRRFPIEVNGAFALSRHADKTALAVSVCMLILPIAIFMRPPRR